LSLHAGIQKSSSVFMHKLITFSCIATLFLVFIDGLPDLVVQATID